MSKKDNKKFSDGASFEGLTRKGAKNPFVKIPVKLPLKPLEVNKLGKEILQDLINDILQASKYPDGTLKDEEKIIQLYLNKWEEEFEDEINLGESYRQSIYPYLTRHQGFEDIFNKYLEVICNGDPMRVKIKARKGCIQIERID